MNPQPMAVGMTGFPSSRPFLRDFGIFFIGFTTFWTVYVTAVWKLG
jgi:hypothetical protein